MKKSVTTVTTVTTVTMMTMMAAKRVKLQVAAAMKFDAGFDLRWSFN